MDMNPKVKDDISRLIEDTVQYVFNELYMDYIIIMGGGEGIRRGFIKHKVNLVIGEDIKEAVNIAIYDVKIPLAYFERVKTLFYGTEHAKQPVCSLLDLFHN